MYLLIYLWYFCKKTQLSTDWTIKVVETNQIVLSKVYKFMIKWLLTRRWIPAWSLTVCLALLNLAILAIVSAAKHLRSLLGESKMFTKVSMPPRSAKHRRICGFLLISFRIFKEPTYVQMSSLIFMNWSKQCREHCRYINLSCFLYYLNRNIFHV